MTLFSCYLLFILLTSTVTCDSTSRDAFITMQNRLLPPGHASFTRRQHGKSISLRFVTFNVGRFRSFVASSIDKSGDSFDSVVQDLRILDPDVIALQEVPKNRVKGLIDEMKGVWDYRYCKYYDERVMVLLVRRNLLKISNWDTIDFWDRCVPVVKVRLEDGSSMVIANLHLSHILRGLRNSQQLTDILANIQRSNPLASHHVLLGDFNMEQSDIENTLTLMTTSLSLDLVSLPERDQFSHWRGITVDHVISTAKFKPTLSSFVKQLGSDHTLLLVDLVLMSS